ncbi:MAG TPA: Mpo1-like protein, partial [Bacteroidia bacterium]
MRAIDSLLNEYGESHQNKTNKLIHWICVPVIFWTITGLLWGIKFPFTIP